MNYDNVLWEQAARYLAGEMDANEEANFLIDVQTDPEKAQWLKDVSSDWRQFEPSLQVLANENEAWDQLNQRIVTEHNPEKKIRRAYLWSASLAMAAVVFMAFMYLFFFRQSDQPLQTIKEIATINSQQRVVLPDGSVVNLNAHTQLSYCPETYSSNRKVTLKGEAFFEVQRIPQRPFVVEAFKVNVRVLGTSFNIFTTSSQSVEVNVKTGKVEVSTQPSHKILLLPGDKGLVLNDTMTKLRSKNENYLAWKTKNIIFDGENLEQAVVLINHVYGSQISTRGLDPSKYIFSKSNFNQLPLNTVMDIICTTFHLRKEIQKGQMILHAR